MNKLLKQLSEIPGVSGDEKAVRKAIHELIEPYVDEWSVDPMGNLIVLKKGTGESDLRVMLDAHMDEVGFLITGVDINGTFKFSTVGGFDDRVLQGKLLQVGPNSINGIIGGKPIHLSSATERRRVTPSSSMRIDIGALNKLEALALVNLGEYATFKTDYMELEHVAIGKAFDDRAGCALIIELLKGEPYPFDLYASFTVQEEVGLRGARTATTIIKPDVAFVIDCTPAYDLPNEADESPNVALGKGTAIYVMDSGTIQDPRLISYLMQTAEENDLPFQLRRPGGGGTNTASVQRSGPGVASATVSLPGRYMHSPHSMINLEDYDNTKQLLDAALRNLTRETIARA
ncbi:MAG: putative aminopeptidase FrvX [Cellvibrionaceae bacterium]|jgi:putative aminopeptidase FrvX